MRAFLTALVLSVCFVPFAARADVIPTSPDEEPCINVATGGRCTLPSGAKGTCQETTCTVSSGSKYVGSEYKCVVCLAEDNSDGGCGCHSARTSRDGLALAFAGSLSLLFVLGKHRWNRRRR
jgi:hypothetical protein